MLPVPPRPDVRIGDLQPVRSVGFGHTYGGVVRYSGNTQARKAWAGACQRAWWESAARSMRVQAQAKRASVAKRK